jgi:hypothetical protein
MRLIPFVLFFADGLTSDANLKGGRLADRGW